MPLPYSEVLEAIRVRDVPHILVVGPQRSGTRFIDNILAKDLRRTYIDERAIRLRKIRMYLDRIAGEAATVTQAPGMTPFVLNLGDESIGIVMVYRPLEDIHRSEHRIGWDVGPHEGIELRSLRQAGFESAYGTERAADLKYEFWEEVVTPRLRNPWWEVDYCSASSHPEWIPPEDRGPAGLESQTVHKGEHEAHWSILRPREGVQIADPL